MALKGVKSFVHKLGVIGVSLKTIYKIDAKYLLLLASSMLLSSMIPFADIYLLRNLLNSVYQNSDLTMVYLIAFSLVILLLNGLKSIVMWYRSIHYINFGHYFDVLNSKKTLDMHYQKLQDKNTLDMTIRAARGCSAIARVGEYASDIISECIKIMGTLAIMIPFCGFYVVLIIAASILCYSIEKFVNRKRYENEKKGDTIERRIDYFLKNVLDTRAAKELRLFKAFDLFISKYTLAENEMYGLRRNTNRVSLLGSCINIIVTAGEIFLMYWLASKRYLDGMIEIGDISLCVSSVAVFTAAISAMLYGFVSVGLMEQRINDFEAYQQIDMNEYRVEGTEKVDFTKDISIEFKNVSYSYPNSSVEILHDINFTIKKGEKIAIVGENGAGKTTFVKLLLRLYTPTKGQVLLNGVDYRNFALDEYYKLFSTVFQDFMLFAYTLRENIMFDDEVNEINVGKLQRILTELEMNQKVNGMRNGLDTYITQEYDMSGVRLSGGEGQHVAIARAWYKNADFLVMDEPTSAIDPIREENLFNKMEKLMNGKTVLLISHRLSSVRLCDKILFFKDGRVSECGTHEELMKNEKEYCHMYQAQAQWYT